MAKRKKERAGLPRRYLLKLYPNDVQSEMLRTQARMCAELWNALLQRQEDTYRRTKGQRGVIHSDGKAHLTYFDMTGEITKLRQACPEWEALSSLTPHRIAKSLTKAFDAFFAEMKKLSDPAYYARRALDFERREGRKPTRYEIAGYPRFKKVHLADAVPHRFKSGCKLVPAGDERFRREKKGGSARAWKLTLLGIEGPIRARGEFPCAPLAYTDADIVLRDGTWWISVCVDMPKRMTAGSEKLSVEFDLIDGFARVERASGLREAVDGSARAPAKSPHHLNTLAGGPGNSEDAKADERETPCHRLACIAVHPGKAEDAKADERELADLNFRVVKFSGNSEDAKADERGELKMPDRRVAQAGNSEDAKADERAAIDPVLSFNEWCPGNSKDAKADERDPDKATLEAAGSAEDAKADAREVLPCAQSPCHGPGNTENAKADERETPQIFNLSAPTVGNSEDAKADEQVAQMPRTIARLCQQADAIKSDRDRRFRPRRGSIAPSIRWLRETERAAKLTGKAARIRREWLHEWSTAIVRHASDLTVILPPIKDTTKSPRGDKNEWGAAVDPVSKLNRSILSMAPSTAAAALKYKAAEAGIRCDEVAPETHQTAVGQDLVHVTKKARRARRMAKRKAS